MTCSARTRGCVGNLAIRAGLGLAILFMAAIFAAEAFATPDFPPLSGSVVDTANILSASTKLELEAELEELWNTTGRQLVVVTLPSLQGYPIEDYGYQLGREWGVGDRHRDDGVLLIVAPTERKVRIEAGYGLEPILTDALSSQIIHSAILPKFRDNDLNGGVLAGVLAIDQQLRLPDDQARTVAERKASSEAAERNRPLVKLVIGLILSILGVLVTWLRDGFFSLRPRAIYRPTSGGGLVTWMPNDPGDGNGGGYGSSGGRYSGGGGSFGGGGASGSW